MREKVDHATARAGWYAHGWNRPLSWELIYRIVPHLPRFLVVPLGHATTLVCFAFMVKERRAARRNLERVTGSRGLSSLWITYRLFHNFSRVMVGYARMVRFDRSLSHVRGLEETGEAIRSALAGGRGLILLTMHLGHWDMGLRTLAEMGMPVHVVMRQEDTDAVVRYASRARTADNIIVHNAGDSPLLALELMSALRRGEIVAIQGDRPFGGGVLEVPFFGAPASLPVGPVQLGMATDAPVLPVAVLLGDGETYRVQASSALSFERVRGDGAETALSEGVAAVARAMESFIARNPDQWFNFFDVWPSSAGRNDAVA